jgi:hypothetical protein
MLVAVCSDKGSPGATTTALAVASAWSGPAVLVEADPYGGDLAIRLRTKSGAALPEAPTVLTLAVARTSGSPALVTRYAQRVNDQLLVVPGHLVAEQLSGIPDWAPFAASLAASTVPVFADLGRIHAASPLLEVAARADVVLLVGSPDAGSVIRLRERLNRLVPVLAAHRGSPPRMFPVLVTPDRHGAADVADLRRILAETAAEPMIVGAGYVALDAVAVARLEDGDSPTGRLARTLLMRSARALVAQVATLVQTHAAPSPAAALERS